ASARSADLAIRAISRCNDRCGPCGRSAARDGEARTGSRWSMTQQFEDTAQAKINRGQRSRQLLDDPVLNQALDALLTDADTAREATKPGDVEVREECH